MKRKTLIGTFLALLLAGLSSYVTAQTTATTKQTGSGTVILERKSAAPQVVTVIHRLNSIEVLRLLLHSGAVGTVDRIDEDVTMKREVHTNILAGLALSDGETIAVWLPEAEVEVDAWPPFTSTTSPSFPSPASPPIAATPGPMELAAGLAGKKPDLMIIGRDGRQHPVRFIGLDGITGLSLLQLSDRSLPALAAAPETELAIDQRVRLLSPEPVPENRVSTASTIRVRIGETEARITSLKRGLTGDVNRLRISSGKLSETNVGGIALDDAGRTIGIVASIEGNEAIILPPAVIRGAAERVLARKGSVPRPWLGVSGESLAFAPLEGILRRGWEPARAKSLIENQSGILLTSVTPGSPAAFAALRPGDVIVRVNNSEVKSTDDFSLLLESAGDSPVQFTVVCPDREEPELLMVTLDQMRDSVQGLWPRTGPRALRVHPLIKLGIETIALDPANRNSSGGLFVVYVQPQSPAFNAGLRIGDLIEAINGQPALKIPRQQFQELNNKNYTLNAVRKKQKLVFVIASTQD